MRKIVIGLLILTIVGIGAVLGYKKWKQFPDNTVGSNHSTATTKNKTTDTVAFDKTRYSIDTPDSIWVVVNKNRPLNPLKYAPADLVAVGSQKMRKAAASAFLKMAADAKTAGLTITPLSGYRSYETQVSVYNNEVKNYGQAVADTESAKPGTSEHQTGLALDVGGGGCGIENCFGNTAEGKWVAANAYKYGFIIRYPAGKQAITGYRYEPWHIRYIGIELAAEMHNKNILTLEEFFDVK